MDIFGHLHAWNPWWLEGAPGINKFLVPDFKREKYAELKESFDRGNQVVSIVGMRQIGKSTLMHQTIRDLLLSGVDPKRILYVSLDDPTFRQLPISRQVIRHILDGYLQQIYTGATYEHPAFVFLDEIQRVEGWQLEIKRLVDQRVPVRVMLSGSAAPMIKRGARESLLGRIEEHRLWPFSFREFVAFQAIETQYSDIRVFIREIADHSRKIAEDASISSKAWPAIQQVYTRLQIEHKDFIQNQFKEFVLKGGFPRAWQAESFLARQRLVWENYVGKVLYQDLLEITDVRKPAELESLFVRLIEFNGKEVNMAEMKKDIGLSHATLSRYLSLLEDVQLVVQVESSKSARFEVKRRASHAKFYVSDIALRNAYYKFGDTLFADPEEMAAVAETLVCSTLERWSAYGPLKKHQVVYFRDRSGETDFLVKRPDHVLPLEVKWRSQVRPTKPLDRLMGKWGLTQGIVVTRNEDLSMVGGKISMPLWFFLLIS